METVEPWLRETHGELPPVVRGLLHALEQAGEDVLRWCEGFSLSELNERPHGLPSVAFQMRHMARSLDRLMTYAEGDALSEAQLAALKEEAVPVADLGGLWAEFRGGLDRAIARALALKDRELAEVRFVGRARIQTTLGGLLVHMAEHTQRHVGQAITTAKVLKSERSAG